MHTAKKIVKRTAKIFMNNQSQAVRLPKDFQFKNAIDVYIRHQGDEVVLSPRPTSWAEFLMHGPVAPADFMSQVDDLPIQERDN